MAIVADRRDLSDVAVADVVSSTLKCVGLISEEDRSLVVDRYNIRRNRIKSRQQIADEKLRNTTPLISFHFDGKRSTTFDVIEQNGRKIKIPIIKENVSIVKQPGDEFLGFISVSIASSKNISDQMLLFFERRNIKLDKLIAIGCDGAPTNTGSKGGIIWFLENHLKRPVHWIVCMIHLNEIAFNKMFVGEDGKTKSGNKYSGPIGSKLGDEIRTRKIVRFDRVTLGDMPPRDANKLRDDQKYLLDIATAVDSGECSPGLAARKPGAVNVARWLSTAARILRLYKSTSSPSDILRKIVEYIMKVYIPIWFRIRHEPTWTFGSRHMFHLINASRQHTPELYSKYLVEVIETNSYFIHPENLILSMISDNDINIREKGYQKILQARQHSFSSSQGVRSYIKPTRNVINYSCVHYSDLLKWDELDTEYITEPPLTIALSTDTIRRCMYGREQLPIPAIPLHTQATERCVQAVGQAAKTIAKTDCQIGYVLNKLEGRSRMPMFKSKKDYC